MKPLIEAIPALSRSGNWERTVPSHWVLATWEAASSRPERPERLSPMSPKTCRGHRAKRGEQLSSSRGRSCLNDTRDAVARCSLHPLRKLIAGELDKMLSSRNATLTLAGLILLMIATRSGLASNLHLQDASWAIFFVGGFYLSARWRWAFPALMVTAGAIDWIAIRYYGVSSYCVTVAYGLLVPAYAASWLGGSWVRRYASFDGRGLLVLGASALISASICFLFSDGSFYWLGHRGPAPTFDGWMVKLATWYWPFVRVCVAYIAAATLFHVLVAKTRPSLRNGGAIASRADPHPNR